MKKGGAAAQISSPEIMVATGSSGLWMRPSPHRHSFLVHHDQFSIPWNDNCQELPADQPSSWSQLLLGGLADGGGKPGGLSDVQGKLVDQTSDYQLQAAKLSTDYQMLSASSPNSCITTNLSNNTAADFSPKSSDHFKRPQHDPSSECNCTAATTTTTAGGAAKKARIQPSSAQSTFKVRKEKLGDRITALHQIVSPFGKTDTASVLLEAIGYIRFLQSQIEALSRPYMGSESAATRQQHPEADEEPKMDLRSRGLCLVPISCTLDVGGDINGADYWAPALCANFR